MSVHLDERSPALIANGRCVVDLKLGTRTYAADAAPEKVRSAGVSTVALYSWSKTLRPLGMFARSLETL